MADRWLLYRYNRAKISRITALNIWKLYIHFVYFKLYVTLSGTRQSLWKMMRAQYLESRLCYLVLLHYIYCAPLCLALLRSTPLSSALLYFPLLYCKFYWYTKIFTSILRITIEIMRVLQGDQGHQGYRGAQGDEGQEVSSMSELFFNISRMVFLVTWFVWWMFLKLTCLEITNRKMEVPKLPNGVFGNRRRIIFTQATNFSLKVLKLSNQVQLKKSMSFWHSPL